MGKKLRIFALGGNEVSPVGAMDLRTGKPIKADIPAQWRRAAKTCELIADIIQQDPDQHYIVTHGNGPQVGNILLRAEYTNEILFPLPLDVCVADTQGAMGYMLAQLGNALQVRGIRRPVAGTVMQVVVDPDDPAFKNPYKFIGPSYTKEEAQAREGADGWFVKPYKKNEQGEDIWRRVVPSPEPQDIVAIEIVEALLNAGGIPIAAGGGGIPVRRVHPETDGKNEKYSCNYGVSFERDLSTKSATDQPGDDAQDFAKVFTGVEAVIDKDLASCLLGTELMKRALARGKALDGELVIFTEADGAKLNFQEPNEQDLRHLTLAEAKAYYEDPKGHFPPGSMGPKVKAAILFLEAGGKKAYIAQVDKYYETLAGNAGTTFVP